MKKQLKILLIVIVVGFVIFFGIITLIKSPSNDVYNSENANAIDAAIEVETTDDTVMKKELNITEESALIIEEESINFKDMIFE
jgi:hypothetical protein